jgi:putative nucleotidyltransferase with HDIG domain
MTRERSRPLGDTMAVPTAREAQALAEMLLAHEGSRLAHVLMAGTVATRIASMFPPEEADLLVAAATLHDIGYSKQIAHTGLHQIDGAVFLRAGGHSERLVRLIANHSFAPLAADERAQGLFADFPAEDGPLADALTYCDMHSAPDGRFIPAELRLADIAARHGNHHETSRANRIRSAVARIEAAQGDAVQTHIT